MIGVQQLSVVVWILAGATLGGAAHALTRNRNRSEIPLNVVTGIAGVVCGAWFLGVLTKAPAFILDEFAPASLLVSLMGAAILLTVLQMLRGRRPGATVARPDAASTAFEIAAHATSTQVRELT